MVGVTFDKTEKIKFFDKNEPSIEVSSTPVVESEVKKTKKGGGIITNTIIGWIILVIVTILAGVLVIARKFKFALFGSNRLA